MTAQDAAPEMLAALRTRAGGREALTFAEFMDVALYDPQMGYYRRAATRVGYGRGTDFFTASTSGPIFGELIAAACATLLGGRDAREFTFVEIGAEPGSGVLENVSHRFAANRTVRLGEPLALTGNCVVFSNELFDAQPFRRFVFRENGWRELGVNVTHARLVEVELPVERPSFLPVAAPEGYVFDAPRAAMELAEKIAGQPWRGVFVACDYGKTWRELIEAAPAGTARAYFRHTQSNDLLARPGEQDLTCHVCWDWLEEALWKNGFAEPTVVSQEAFFVRHAESFLATTSAAEAAGVSPRKLALMQLLHPAHLGRKFQVLHAIRM